MKKAKYMILGTDLDGSLCGRELEGYIFVCQGIPMGVAKYVTGKWRLTHLPTGMGITQLVSSGYDTRKQAVEWYNDPDHLRRLQRLLNNLPESYYDIIRRAYDAAENQEEMRPAVEMINGAWEY